MLVRFLGTPKNTGVHSQWVQFNYADFKVQIHSPRIFWSSLQSKETQKVHQRFSPFLPPEMKKTGFRTADPSPESPILPVFARFLPKTQEKTPFVAVDKRGFFHGRSDWIRRAPNGALPALPSPVA